MNNLRALQVYGDPRSRFAITYQRQNTALTTEKRWGPGLLPPILPKSVGNLSRPPCLVASPKRDKEHTFHHRISGSTAIGPDLDSLNRVVKSPLELDLAQFGRKFSSAETQARSKPKVVVMFGDFQPRSAMTLEQEMAAFAPVMVTACSSSNVICIVQLQNEAMNPNALTLAVVAKFLNTADGAHPVRAYRLSSILGHAQLWWWGVNHGPQASPILTVPRCDGGVMIWPRQFNWGQNEGALEENVMMMEGSVTLEQRRHDHKNPIPTMYLSTRKGKKISKALGMTLQQLLEMVVDAKSVGVKLNFNQITVFKESIKVLQAMRKERLLTIICIYIIYKLYNFSVIFNDST
uniref:Menorin-like domain-containing protein n=1 Tax=Timema monikensis TaxID=170555 RepID=A0A7R9HM07_9NEOP|nr:unnamed protein product [Timema monikensis]